MNDAPEFPFSAVVGQAPLKLALVLCALDPRLGGVLASGPRGAAKSTLARGLAALLPDAANTHFVTLPLGADEARLTGTLDLQRALGEREVAFQPGLLAQAHGGVLYIDEVNLLPDALVDLLLDVAASGVNRVERDGVSHHHAADFLLVGTMNPDEGELRAQLTDRFGLAVLDHPAPDVDERMTIVARRLAFDRDPWAFSAQWQPAQQALSQRLEAARARLAQVQLSDRAAREIAGRCVEAQVEGVRADLAWRRGALAHAAWQGRETVTDEDIEPLEALVMAHRAPHWLAGRDTRTADEPTGGNAASKPEDDTGQRGENGAQQREGQDSTSGYSGRQRPATPSRRPDLNGGDSAGSTADDPTAGQPGPDEQDEHDTAAGDWGALETPRAPALTPAAAPRLRLDAAPVSAPGHRRTPRGHRSTDSHHIDWPTSLAAGLPRRPDQLRHRREPRRPELLEFILLDTSGSALESGAQGARRLERALGAVEQISRRAYLARHQLMINGFGGATVRELVAPQRAPRRLDGLAERLGAGGGTPLRRALLDARRRITRLRRHHPERAIRLWIVTDACSRDDFAIAPLAAEVHVIDCELLQRQGRRGRAAELAAALGGRLHHFEAAPAPDAATSTREGHAP
ncbi:AAA family ATPase [Kushneria aurantia]|uniref:AAA family ATPase n=1 Tax=Kushneria aurantia TaxID=504092 RepID=A0ABV6G4D5_9GAMM|nr:AAA family ATPase [Kushneria aurantia]